ncbi:TRAP transporter small permease [Chachezhania antarctica]|uniref:TRAP transporter small permease n=1 Tax=Chachezhania antarctica TaxID=2340860 RepID=UPI000EB028DD|nr:TRAP transporter small permease [Chachezhania antarctica]|tara:strand:+ start:2942 stop:3478 length:537 start_codon:yes stop_codon:yes gene_type:complete
MSEGTAEKLADGPVSPVDAGPGYRRWPRRALAVISGLILLIMMALTAVDVVGRYVLNSPLIGATELTELLLVSVVFIGLPAVCLDDEHVTVDLVTSALPDWIQPFRKALLAVITATVLAVIAWRLWVHADQIASYNAVTNSLRLPVAPVARLCAATTAASVLITLYVALRDLRTALKG